MVQPSQPTPKKPDKIPPKFARQAYRGANIGANRIGAPKLPDALRGATAGAKTGTNRTLPPVGKRIDSIPQPKAAPRKK
jgi:hypothetical protein